MLIAQNASILNPAFSMLFAMETIGERIARLRAAKAISKSELARRVGVTPSAINQIESGVTKAPKVELMFAIADTLDVDARSLTFGEKAALEAWDRAIFKIVDDLPSEQKQEVLDFTLYKIERAQHLIASDKLAKYLTMIDKIKHDMASKK
jgi:transcriptional regulator with XRE-family HTH domain